MLLLPPIKGKLINKKVEFKRFPLRTAHHSFPPCRYGDVAPSPASMDAPL